MESVDPTISTFLQPSFDAQLPVMKMATDLTAPCIMDQIILYFEMAYPRHERRTALTNLRARDYPSDSKFILAYQETAKDAAYNVSSPFVQEVLVNQAIAALEDEERREKLRLRYKDGWTLEYVAALLAKWESSQASVDQQGRNTYKARRQAPASISAVQQPRTPARPPPAAASATSLPATPSRTPQGRRPRCPRGRPTPSAPATNTAPRQSSGSQPSTATPSKPCYRCGGAHPNAQCPYLSHTCEECNIPGHPSFHCQKNRSRCCPSLIRSRAPQPHTLRCD